MRAALAFLNGAGVRRRRRSGNTDRGLLVLTDLLLNPTRYVALRARRPLSHPE
jgi:hypothetical protein